MDKFLTRLCVVVLSSISIVAVFNTAANEFEVSGKVAVEQRYFPEAGQNNEQLSHRQSSVALEAEFFWGWNNGSDTLTFKPFYRFDEQDDERTHGDIRELSYIHASDDWEFRAGIRREFWGVTEFQHLVDVINQTDGVEDFDGEDKLGQLMVNFSMVKEWGIVDVFLLPGFRHREFTGQAGRLRAALLVDDDNISYQSSAEQQHLDFALRWSHTLGDFDIGSYWFHGTNRDPYLTPVTNTPIQSSEQFVLQQHYSQMDQFGMDVQATLADWLWKFEAIYRTDEFDDYWATQGGFEYSFIGVFDSNADLGILLEYGWDSRGEGNIAATIQNDLFFGGRIAFNDMQSSEVLFGFGADLDHNAFSFLVEANRRFGENFKVNFDVRLFQSTDEKDALSIIKDDDHAQLSIEWYF